jgi:hypothetical protein
MCLLAVGVGGSYEWYQKMASYVCCSVVMLLCSELVVATGWNEKKKSAKI